MGKDLRIAGGSMGAPQAGALAALEPDALAEFKTMQHLRKSKVNLQLQDNERRPFHVR